MELIELRIALDIIGQGKPFQCRFVKYNRRTRKGGQIVELKEAVKLSRHIQAGVIRVKLPNGQVREFHQRLMTHFNNKKVTW